MNLYCIYQSAMYKYTLVVEKKGGCNTKSSFEVNIHEIDVVTVLNNYISVGTLRSITRMPRVIVYMSSSL